MKGSNIGKIIGWVFVGIGIAAGLGLVLGLGMQWLWNQLMPEIFGLPPISYWQAVGLFVLSHLLFKGHHPMSPSENTPKRRKFFDSCAKNNDASPKPPNSVAEKIRVLLDDERPAE